MLRINPNNQNSPLKRKVILNTNQEKIIDLCQQINNNSITDQEIAESIINIRSSKKQPVNLFNSQPQISPETIYAWVSVYACKHGGTKPTDISYLQNFITTNFKEFLTPGYSINIGLAEQYFDNITNSKTEEEVTHFEETYNFSELEKNWKKQSLFDISNKTHNSAVTITANNENSHVLNNNKIYLANDIEFTLSTLAKKMVKEQFEIFKTICQNKHNISCKDNSQILETEILAIQTAIIKQIKSINFNQITINSLFKSIITSPEGILTNKKHPFTMQIFNILIEWLSAGHKTCDNYKIFETIFFDPKKYLENIDENQLRDLKNAMIMHIQKSTQLGSKQDFGKIFKDVFTINTDKFVIGELNELQQAIIGQMKNGIRYLDFFFNEVYIKRSGIFKNDDEQLTKKIKSLILECISNTLENHITKFKSTNNLYHKVNDKDIYHIFQTLYITQKTFNHQQKTIDSLHGLIIKAIEEGVIFFLVLQPVFFAPEKIFQDNNNLQTQNIQNAIITQMSISNSKRILLYSKEYIQLFEHVFISQTGIFQDLNNQITKKMKLAITQFYPNFSSQDKTTICNYYLKDTENKYSELEQMLLNLLLNNKLNEPEIVRKLILRMDNNKINVADTNQNLNWFVEQCSHNQVYLINILTNNISYFIKKDNKDVINKVLQHNLLIAPLSYNSLKSQIVKNLINKLQQIKIDIDINFIKDTIVEEFSTSIFLNNIDNNLKQSIEDHKTQNEWVFKTLGANALNILLNAVKGANTPTHINTKVSYIKQYILRHLPNDTELSDEISKLAKSLNDINPEEIKKAYIITNFIHKLEIADENHDAAYQILNLYSNWAQAISLTEKNNLAQIRELIVSKDQTLENLDQSIYYCYVMNTLPYRNAKDIYSILSKTKIFPQQILHFLGAYCHANGLNSQTDTPLSIIQGITRQQKPIFIGLENISHLNFQNTQDLTIEHFKIYQMNNSSQALLSQLIRNAPGDEINLNIPERKILEEKMLTIVIGNTVKPELLQLILDENNMLKSSISKANLEQLLHDRNFLRSLFEIITEEVSLDSFKQNLVPNYLKKLVENKYTASNIIAEEVLKSIKDIISQNKFELDINQQKKFDTIILQKILAIGADITVTIDFKQKLMDKFKDKAFHHDIFEKIVLATSAELEKLTDNQLKYNQLPNIFLDQYKQFESIDKNEQLLEILFDKLNKLPSLQGKINKDEICYMLGVIYMDLSSVNALGYHSTTENVAFSRFRLLSGYWLAKALELNTSWSAEVQLALLNQLKTSLLTGDCSGIVLNNLLGRYDNQTLKNLYQKIQKILSAILIL